MSDLARALRELNIPFAIIGALVPELLLRARPPRMTYDVDVTVVVESRADFEALKDRLAAYGFDKTTLAYRLRHRSGGLVDILPYSATLAPEGKIELEEGRVMNMAGFGQLVPRSVPVSITKDLVVPIAPLPLFILLKLVAFGDRRQPKDLAGVVHTLEHYEEDSDRRYGLDHRGEGVPFEYTGAYLAGRDGREFLDAPLRAGVLRILEAIDDEYATPVSLALQELGLSTMEDKRRTEIFQYFRWFRLGIDL